VLLCQQDTLAQTTKTILSSIETADVSVNARDLPESLAWNW
jgi:hypothetical protein